MAYIQIPTVAVETPLGPMNAHLNNDKVVVFNQSGEQVLTVNRVAYHCYFTAELIDGTWQIAKYENGRQSTLNLNRVGSYKVYDYSRAAFEKAAKILGEWLPGWAAKQTLLLAEAETLAAEGARQAAESKVGTAMKTLEDAKTELYAAETRCHKAEARFLNLRNVTAEAAPAIAEAHGAFTVPLPAIMPQNADRATP